MKNWKKFFLLLVPVLLLLIAARPLQTQPPADWLTALVTYFLSLAGFAAFITFVVNIAKRFGLPDGSADTVVKWLNLLGLVIVGVLQAAVPDVIPTVDKILGLLAQLGGVIFPIVFGLFSWPVANAVSKFAYNHVRGFKFLALGYSHSKG